MCEGSLILVTLFEVLFLLLIGLFKFNVMILCVILLYFTLLNTKVTFIILKMHQRKYCRKSQSKQQKSERNRKREAKR